MDSAASLWAQLEPKLDSYFTTLYNMENLGLLIQTLLVISTVMVTAELVWDTYKGKRRSLRDFAEPAVNLTFQLGMFIVERSALSIVSGIAFVFLSAFAVAEIPHTALSWVICFILMDFCYYWMHRWDHKIRFLWTMHSVHHSSEEYDFTTALRMFWLVSLTQWLFYVPLVLIGFSPIQVVVCMTLQPFYGLWLHTEKIGRIPVFEQLFNTPSFHRVHHGTNRQYLDKNFAGILVIWDRMFGSYAPEVEKINYGLTKAINTQNPLKVGFHEFIELGSAMRRANNWNDRVRYLIKGPGWKPKPASQHPNSATPPPN